MEFADGDHEILLWKRVTFQTLYRSKTCHISPQKAVHDITGWQRCFSLGINENLSSINETTQKVTEEPQGCADQACTKYLQNLVVVKNHGGKRNQVFRKRNITSKQSGRDYRKLLYFVRIKGNESVFFYGWFSNKMCVTNGFGLRTCPPMTHVNTGYGHPRLVNYLI